MKCRDMITHFEKQFPLSAAEPWDNVGLQTGSGTKEIKTVYVALDATDKVVADAAIRKADMLLTHHPLIFSPLKRVCADDFIGRRVTALVQNDIAYYAMHTNYDVCRMSELAAEYISLREPHVLIETGFPEQNGTPGGLGRIGDLGETMTLRACCELIKGRFRLANVKAFGSMNKMVRRAAIFPGSGKSAVDAAVGAHADVLITGDIDHHTGIDAAARGVSVIDAGHYGIEHIFIKDMKSFIEKSWRGVTVYTPQPESPFQIV